MFRKLLCHWLGAELEPNIDWSEIDGLQIVARISVESPQFFGGTQTVEQVLCRKGNQLLLYNRWHKAGRLSRVNFNQTLNGQEMRLVEKSPSPNPTFRLMVPPIDSDSVTFACANPTWFGLWKNEAIAGLGGGICFIDSADREQLKNLRSQLLDGNVPESLLAEEEMWERVNGLSDADRRAALAMQSLAQVDQKFHEEYPDAGPVPGDLQPAFDRIQQQVKNIEQTASDRPVDPELAKLMQRFVLDATQRDSPPDAP